MKVELVFSFIIVLTYIEDTSENERNKYLDFIKEAIKSNTEKPIYPIGIMWRTF